MMLIKKFCVGILIILFSSIFTSGCRSEERAFEATPTSTVVGQTSQTSKKFQRSGIANIQVSPTPSAVLPTTPATVAPTAMIFWFPTQVVDQNTIWRPPLYSVPWEPSSYDHFYFTRPIGANEVNWPLANYRYGGTFIKNVIHTGVDIPAPKGTPVMAAGPGEVIWAGFGLFFQSQKFSDPYGLAIAIKHDFGYEGKPLYTIYGHLDAISVANGQVVGGSETIGVVGETGKVTGPHLHFEVRIGDNNFYVTRNPELWIAPPQGWGVLVARIMETNGETLMKHPVHLRKRSSNLSWSVMTYASGGVNSDPFYRENMVIGDLPAGEYIVSTDYREGFYSSDLQILPGQVTFVRFVGNRGFSLRPPTVPPSNFIPPDVTPAPTP